MIPVWHLPQVSGLWAYEVAAFAPAADMISCPLPWQSVQAGALERPATSSACACGLERYPSIMFWWQRPQFCIWLTADIELSASWPPRTECRSPWQLAQVSGLAPFAPCTLAESLSISSLWQPAQVASATALSGSLGWRTDSTSAWQALQASSRCAELSNPAACTFSECPAASLSIGSSWQRRHFPLSI